MNPALLRVCAAALISFFAIGQPAAKKQQPKSKAPAVEIPVIPARPEDVSNIDGIVRAYYEVVSGPAGQPRQWSRDRTLYIPGVRFVDLRPDKNGNVAAHSLTHQEFVDASDAALRNKAFYEHEIHRIIHRFGNIAHVLSTAEQQTSLNGPVIGHSIDSLELFYDGHRWWIAGANIWNPASPDEALPKEFMP